MGKQIYDKPIWLLFKEFANGLKENEVFRSQVVLDWFRENYPKIKESSARAHLIRLTTNHPTRVYYKATNKDDLFFQINSSHFRKYNPPSDPEPIYFTTSKQKIVTPKLTTRINRSVIEARISDLIENFYQYLNYFTENIKFSGPSIYFHKKVVEKIRNSERYEELLMDDLFFDYLYATLASWGMHRMGDKTAKMAEYDDMKQSICRSKEQILNLINFRLEAIPEEQLNRVKENLRYLFNSLKIMESDTKLIGNSKALHHLLPDLVTPIDRQHTLRFFYNKTNINTYEEEMFLDLFDRFLYISKFLELDRISFEGFNTSVPKVIDNAIMGYVMKNLKSQK